MADRPAFITMRLTQPRLEHPSVAWLQERVNLSKYVRPALLVDGVFGPHTAQEAEEYLYRLGAPRPIAAMSPANMVVLWNQSQGHGLPPDWRARRIERMGKGFIKGWGITARSWLGLHPAIAPPPPGASLRVYTREEIGLRPPKRRSPRDIPTSYGGVVHWQGPGHGATGIEAAMAQARGFQRYHMDTLGWSDIGYHYGIPRGCDVGTVFEFRGDDVHGAHSGHNTANARLGILIGFGRLDGAPTADQYTTLSMFLRAKARGRLTGHQEWFSTACPGTAVMGWVRSHRIPS